MMPRMNGRRRPSSSTRSRPEAGSDRGLRSSSPFDTSWPAYPTATRAANRGQVGGQPPDRVRIWPIRTNSVSSGLTFPQSWSYAAALDGIDGGWPAFHGRGVGVLPHGRRRPDPRDLAASAPVLGADGPGGAEPRDAGGSREVQLRGPGGAEDGEAADRRRRLGPADPELHLRAHEAPAERPAAARRAGAGGDRRRGARVPRRRRLRRDLRPGMGLRGGSLPARGRRLEAVGGGRAQAAASPACAPRATARPIGLRRGRWPGASAWLACLRTWGSGSAPARALGWGGQHARDRDREPEGGLR